MPKMTLTFDLDDHGEFANAARALHANDAWGALEELRERLRGELKYSSDSWSPELKVGFLYAVEAFNLIVDELPLVISLVPLENSS